MNPRYVLFSAAFLAAGCGGKSIVPVSGRVTFDGKPAAGVHVSFQPMGIAGEKNPGGGSYAITDADGRFTLKMVESDAAGAVVGQHRVEVTSRLVEDNAHDTRSKPADPKAFIPPKFNRDSKLTFDVPGGGTKDANFDLTTK
jgi:hypothetical protein